MKLLKNITLDEEGQKRALKFSKYFTWAMITFIFVLLFIESMILPNFKVGNITSRSMLLLISFVIFLFVIIKHFKKIPPDKIAAVFFLETPLMVLKTGGTYFISPFFKIVFGDVSIIKIEMDSSDPKCWKITTATKNQSDIDRAVRAHMKTTKPYATEDEIIKEVEKFELKLKSDKEHTDVTLRPSVNIQIQIDPDDFLFFLKNVSGNTYEEKISWVKNEILAFAFRCLEQELKFRSYAMVKTAMTGMSLNDSLKNHMESLIDAKSSENGNAKTESRLGFNCIRAIVTGLGSPKEIQDAGEKVAVAMRNAEAIGITAEATANATVTEAEGLKKASMKKTDAGRYDKEQLGKGQKEFLTQEGEGLASQVEHLLKAVKENGGDQKRIAELQLELANRKEMVKGSNITYFSETGNTDKPKSREMYLILDELKKMNGAKAAEIQNVPKETTTKKEAKK